MRKLFWFIAIAVFAPSTSVFADGAVTCTAEPQSKWIGEAEMKNRIAGMGYKLDVFKVSRGGCYEVYGRDPAGKRVEVFFNPLTGDLVKPVK